MILAIDEKWIESYEGLYAVNTKGVIRSFHMYKRKETRTLKYDTDKEGYLKVTLTKNKAHKKYLVSRLVAQAFIQNPENKPEVNHIDGNKKNNSVENLEWVTRSENELHAYKFGLQKAQRGENRYNAKLSNEKVIQIKKLLAAGRMTQMQISKLFNISNSIISEINTGKRWAEVVI